MKRTTVVNMKHTKEYDVRIDRWSKWGNPFRIGKDGDRQEVVEKYMEYIIMERPDLMEALPELEGKVLGCWCKPKLCHGDALIKLIGGWRP